MSLDAEAFNTLRRLVGRLRGESPLVGEERRNLAGRMNTLIQKAKARSPSPSATGGRCPP